MVSAVAGSCSRAARHSSRPCRCSENSVQKPSWKSSIRASMLRLALASFSCSRDCRRPPGAVADVRPVLIFAAELLDLLQFMLSILELAGQILQPLILLGDEGILLFYPGLQIGYGPPELGRLGGGELLSSSKSVYTVGGKLIHACLPKPVPGFVNPSPVRVAVRTSQRLAKTGLGGLGRLSVITLSFLILYVRRLFAGDFRARVLSYLISCKADRACIGAFRWNAKSFIWLPYIYHRLAPVLG